MISVVNIWEIQIKLSVGKLDLQTPLEEIVQGYLENEITILPITTAHVLALARFPMYHRDPFDRILIAQALTENMTLLSKDPLFKQYPVKVFW